VWVGVGSRAREGVGGGGGCWLLNFRCWGRTLSVCGDPRGDGGVGRRPRPPFGEGGGGEEAGLSLSMVSNFFLKGGTGTMVCFGVEVGAGWQQEA